jgi:4-amino-4-deoxy-L-arabinose transferase-like glycosyltransferase
MNPPLTSSDERRPSAPWLLALLLAYFAAHVLSRIFVSDALELDEAEQAVWTQQLAAGYGVQPPLYTWLQWGMFQVAGVSVLSLSLLKNALLALTYVFVWLAARRMMAAPLALLASASMLLLPQIGWESQRDLTHSVLVTTLAAATLCIVVRLAQNPSPGLRPALHVALGAAIGLGALSKYSFAMFATALALAVLTTPQMRGVWRTRWIFLSMLVAVVVVAPHALWLVDHWHLASARTLEKLGAAPGVLSGFARGLGSLGNAFAATLAALALALAAVFGRAAWPRTADAPYAAFWRHYLIALVALLLAMVFIGGASHFKGRWLQPLLFMAPLIYFCGRPDLASHPRRRWLHRTLFALALLFITLLSLRPVFDGWRDRPDELNEPVAELASALIAAGYDGQAPIVTHDKVLAGVLRIRFPRAPVSVWQPGGTALAAMHGRHLLIGKGADGAAFLAHAGVASPSRITLPYRHARPDHAPINYVHAFGDGA